MPPLVAGSVARGGCALDVLILAVSFLIVKRQYKEMRKAPPLASSRREGRGLRWLPGVWATVFRRPVPPGRPASPIGRRAQGELQRSDSNRRSQGYEPRGNDQTPPRRDSSIPWASPPPKARPPDKSFDQSGETGAQCPACESWHRFRPCHYAPDSGKANPELSYWARIRRHKHRPVTEPRRR